MALSETQVELMRRLNIKNMIKPPKKDAAKDKPKPKQAKKAVDEKR
jgi:hypothetical protein